MKKYKETMNRIHQDIEEYKEDLKLSRSTHNEREHFITIDLSQEEIYQPYSQKMLLNEGIYSFIENSYHYVKKNSEISFQYIFPDNIDRNEQNRIKKLVKVHYAISCEETTNEIHRTNLRGLIVLFFGIGLFAIFGLLEWFEVNFIFRGVIEIFSWVFIWEACNCFAFTNTKNKLNRLKYIKLFDAARK